jgi:putative ABC transport system permease protein
MRRRDLDRELEEELRFHIEKEVEQNRARGMSDGEARTAALRAFGGLERVKEEARDVRGVRHIEETWQDVRYGLRSMRKSPAFTLLVALTLALGIGATTAIFTLINAVLLRPLQYPDSQRLISVWSYNLQPPGRYPVSGPDFLDWKKQSRSLEDMAAYRGGAAPVVVNATAENVGAYRVSFGFFQAAGVRPIAGRLFGPDEVRAKDVAVVAESIVRRHFGDDPTLALKSTLKVRGQTVRIIGVMPSYFRFPEGAEIWTPFDTDSLGVTNRGAHNYQVIARLVPRVSLAQAQSEMDGIAARLTEAFPDTNARKGAKLVPLPALLVDRYESTLWIMFGAVGLVLLIACANIANLLMARGLRRVSEVAVRAALGAGLGRIARQFLTESLLLALLGAVLGVAAARWALRALVALAPSGIPRLDEVAIDRSTFAFAGAICLVVCLITGMFPVLQSARMDLNLALRAGGRGLTGTRGRLRGALVVSQLAISVVLLAGAGLLLRSFQRLTNVDPGYRSENLLVMTANHAGRDIFLNPEAAAVGAGERAPGPTFFEELTRRAASLPGVASVSFTDSLPIDDVGSNGTYWVEGRPPLPPGEGRRRNAIWRLAGPDYLTVIQASVKAGRQIDRRDTREAPATVVINESMARASWPGENPIGHRIRIGWDDVNLWMTIVGVVADTRQRSLDAPVGQELFVPALQHPRLGNVMKVVARTTIEPEALKEAFRRVAQSLDREVPLKFTTAELMVAETLAAPRFRTLLIGLFAAIALVLAVVGVAGVMACIVGERQAEIGLRVAVGARPKDVVRHLLGRALPMVLLGLAIGLVGALTGARVLDGLLFETSTAEPGTLVAVSVLLVLAAVGAASVPAVRAARVSPMSALRAE